MLIDYIKEGVFIDMSSDSEIENETNPSLDELKTWKVVEHWRNGKQKKRNEKIGNKDILLNRFYMGMKDSRFWWILRQWQWS